MSNKEYKLFNILLGIALVVLGLMSLSQQGHFQCVYTEIGTTCNGCGLTRSFRASLLLQFKDAWVFNPAGIWFYLWWLINVVYRVISIFTLSKSINFIKYDVAINTVALIIFIISIYI